MESLKPDCVSRSVFNASFARRQGARYFEAQTEKEADPKEGVTTFDFGEWRSKVASPKNDDGSISFITIDPGVGAEDAFEFVAEERGGKRVLIIRDGQHEYIFTEAA
jgi:hypothetical protein